MKTQPKLTKKQIEKLSSYLVEKFEKEKRQRRYAQVELVLSILGKGVFLPTMFIAPGIARLSGKLFKGEKGWDDWKKYNLNYLRQTISRLEKQKLVKLSEEAGKQVVKLTKDGKLKILKYAIKELKTERPKTWDRKWRLVIYDIPTKKKQLQNIVRGTLKRLGFLKIQESVYLIPFPCFDEIKFLREYYGLGDNIKILIVTKLEREVSYRTYFGV